MNYLDLVCCIVGGLVATTAGSQTLPPWGAIAVGLIAAPAYFAGNWFVREKLQVDDPLAVIPVHGICGFLGLFLEGLFSESIEEPGLFHGGFKHFGVQTMGSFAMLFANLFISWVLWKVVMENILFRNTPLRMTSLDAYIV